MAIPFLNPMMGNLSKCRTLWQSPPARGNVGWGQPWEGRSWAAAWSNIGSHPRYQGPTPPPILLDPGKTRQFVERTSETLGREEGPPSSSCSWSSPLRAVSPGVCQVVILTVGGGEPQQVWTPRLALLPSGKLSWLPHDPLYFLPSISLG